MKSPLIDVYERDIIDPDRFEQWLADNGMLWNPLSRGEYGVTLQQMQMAYVSKDPVLWCKAFMKEPDTGEPYTFWDYQIESLMSYDQDVLHKDAAEVGKTREITALILWSMCTSFGGAINRPSILVAAPQQTHLDEIIMDMEEHVGEAKDMSGAKPFINYFWRKPKKHPHYMARFVTPNPINPKRPGIGRVYFRPAGHDGEAFRGVHVNGLGLFDEAAKIKNKVSFSEFFRALKPGCNHRLYSVPDGDTGSQFHAMSQKAIPNLPKGTPGLRLFHWAKTLMPDPFWNEERKQHFIRMYGGEDASGYQRNVLGEDGQQESTVWPWATLEPNFVDVPEYRAIKLHADAANNDLHIEAYRVEHIRTGDKTIGENRTLEDRHEDLDDYTTRNLDLVRLKITDLLRQFVLPPEKGVYWFGADLGYSKDPTEIMVWREIGTQMRRILRIHMKGMGYDQQQEIIFCLDQIFGFQGAWGVDFGNAGSAVVQALQNRVEYEAGNYEDRLTGFLFGESMDAIDEEGEVLTREDKKTGDLKPVKLPAKELATNLMTARFQRHGFASPLDADIVQHYSNHTAKEGARHQIYSKIDDHTIDADRVAMLRKVFNEEIAVDVFASGTNERTAA